MTDLSKFDGHTQGPWERAAIVSLAGESMILLNGAKATDADLALMVSAPALLARVKELEALLKRIHSASPRGGDYNGEYGVDKVLQKEWL